MPESVRFADKELQQLRSDFNEHLKKEEEEQRQQQELYEAIFQKEDKEANVPPGLLQITARIDGRLAKLEENDKRQKNFIGGVTFAFTCMGFLFTDSAHKVLAWLKGL